MRLLLEGTLTLIFIKLFPYGIHGVIQAMDMIYWTLPVI